MPAHDSPAAPEAASVSVTPERAPAAGQQRRPGRALADAATDPLQTCSDLAAAAAPKPTGRISPNKRIADKQRLRARFGLRSSIWWVRKVGAARFDRSGLSGLAKSLFRDFGTKITPDEASELARRQGERARSTLTILNRYGRQHRAIWAGSWIDHTDGRMTAALTKDVAKHRRAALEAHTAGPQLEAHRGRSLTCRVGASTRPGAAPRCARASFPGRGSRTDVIGGHVEIHLGVLDDAARAFMAEQFADGDPICPDGPDPAELVPEGPQPLSGPGWRLLVDRPGGEVLTTSAALTKRQYRKLWQRLKLGGRRAPVDFDSEIVLHFAPAISPTCPNIRLDELVIGNRRVYPLIVMPGPLRSCVDLAGPHTYLLAVERDALPTAFRVQLDKARFPCPRCARKQVTDVDLDAGTVRRR